MATETAPATQTTPPATAGATPPVAGHTTPAPAAATPEAVDTAGLGVAVKGITSAAATLASLATTLAGTPAQNTPNPGALFGGQSPFVTSGPVGRDSEGYSLMKMASVSMGAIQPDSAKTEIDLSDRLKTILRREGFRPEREYGTWLVPFSTAHLPMNVDGVPELARECKAKMIAGVAGFDRDQAMWMVNKYLEGEARTKAIGTLSDAAGGTLRDFPALGELIDLQRNREALTQAGCTEIALPPSGHISYPKLTGAATGYMVGEGASITSSQQSTGNLHLRAKKGAAIVPMNNEFLRFVNAQGEAMVRLDLARVMARLMDLQELQGTGGDINVLGLINYPDITTHTAVDVPADANTGYRFLPEDAALMSSELPDAIDEPTAIIMRKNLWGKIQTRRADAVAPGDGQGGFVFNWTRTTGDRPAYALDGTPVIRSAQVSATRTRGSASNLTYAISGYFPDWVRARFGVMEVVANAFSDTFFGNDQTGIRVIQRFDAGARHGASFNLFDAIRVA